MNKFWKKIGEFFLIGLGMVILLFSCQTTPVTQSQPTTTTPTATPTTAQTPATFPPVASVKAEATLPATLPPLPYAFGAL